MTGGQAARRGDSPDASPAAAPSAAAFDPLAGMIDLSDYMDALPEPPRNLNGQRLGRKGRDTRDRILGAATRLIYCAPPPGALSMSAVAREAALGLPSLYNYFADLSELLAAILDPVMAEAEEAYLAGLRRRWQDDEIAERTCDFVRGYQSFWAKHSRLLHLRNRMTDEGDARMGRARIKATQPIIGLLVRQMDGDPAAPRSREFAMATVLMIGIERSITISTDSDLPARIAENIQHDGAHFLRPCARLLEMAIADMRRK